MRPTLGVAQRVELARAPIARDPNRLFEAPPFSPAAERCARTWVLSIEAVPITGLWPVSALNIPSQIPCRLQRLKQL
jgi:hypothetical protein